MNKNDIPDLEEPDDEFDDLYIGLDYDDICYECTGYGDDYSIDENGELVNNCEGCPFNQQT